MIFTWETEITRTQLVVDIRLKVSAKKLKLITSWKTHNLSWKPKVVDVGSVSKRKTVLVLNLYYLLILD